MNTNIDVLWLRYLNDFMSLSENGQLKQLKRDLDILQPAQCGYYAEMLDSYIQQVGINYIPFVSEFNENDIQTMKTKLRPDKCHGNTYKSVLHWLDALLYLNKFIRLSENEKLKWLKIDLHAVAVHPADCWVYGAMLDRYIQQVGANHTPFVSEFNDDETKIIIQNLRACPNDEYDTIINWISQRHQSSNQSSLNKFSQQSERGQVKFLKDNLTVITPENCAEYAEYLSAYVDQYGKNYYVSKVFTDMFNRSDIAQLLSNISHDRCTTNRTTINWLQQAAKPLSPMLVDDDDDSSSKKRLPSSVLLPIITKTIVPTPKPNQNQNQNQKGIATIIKKQAAEIFTTNLTTNFTRVAAYNADPRHQFQYQSCDIKVDKMTERSKDSQSGANIYMAKAKPILSNSNELIIKMWINDNNSWQVHCLNAEWAIYKYIIPFLFYKLITPCVLIPFQTGECTAHDFTNKIRPLIQKLNPNVKSPSIVSHVRYIATPNIPMSLYDFLTKDNSEIQHGMKSDMMYALMFHLVYTVTAFAALGLRHNDCHIANIRIVCYPNQNQNQNPANFRMGFKLQDGKTRVYSTLPIHPVFFDFDRMGVDNQLWPAEYHNVCTHASTPYCNIGQCSESIDGRRDLLIIVVNMYNYLHPDLKTYLLDNVLTGTRERLNRFNKYMIYHNDNTIHFVNQQGYENFVFRDLTDDVVVKLYPKSSTILNDPVFLRLCTTKSAYMQKSESVKNNYTMYSYKNKLNKFSEYIRQFHQIS